MTPLISIAIPTYNRPDSLKKLYANFLSKIVECKNVEVVICDNSDPDQESSNKNLLNSQIKYIKNKKT